MPDIGSEGIAWAEIDGASYFYVCIDTAKRTGMLSVVYVGPN